MLEREGARSIADLPETDVTDADAVQALVDSCDELRRRQLRRDRRRRPRDRLPARPLPQDRRGEPDRHARVLSLAAAKMAENEPDEEGTRGVVVNTASNAAFDGQIGQAAYSASKAGVAGMTLPVARDLASKGSASSRSRPGRPTRRCSGRCGRHPREPVSQIPFPKRLGRAEDFAALVKHIVENEYLNGEVIRSTAPCDGTEIKETDG